MKKMSAKLVLLTLLATAGLCTFSYESWALEAGKLGVGSGAPVPVFNGPGTNDEDSTVGGFAGNQISVPSGAPGTGTEGLADINTATPTTVSTGVKDLFEPNAADAAAAGKSTLPPVTDNTSTIGEFRKLQIDGFTPAEAEEILIKKLQEEGFTPIEAKELAKESANAPVSAASIALKSSGTVNSAQCDVIRAKVLAAAELKIQQTADTIRKQTAVGPTSLLSCSEISAQGIANTMSKVGKGSAGSLLSAFVDGSKIASSGTKVNVNVNGILNGVMASGGKVSVKSVLGGILGGTSGVSCKNTLSDAMKAIECTSNVLSKKGAAADCVNVKKISGMFGAGKSSQVKEIEKGLKKDSKKPIEGLNKEPPVFNNLPNIPPPPVVDPGFRNG